MAALIAALAGLGGFVLGGRSAVRDQTINGGAKLADRGARSVSCDAGSSATLVSIDSRTGAVRAIRCTAVIRVAPPGSGDPLAKVLLVTRMESLVRLVLHSVDRAANAP